ncbi:MAG: Cell surface protein, partial [Ramlibacter sp.]|nr:Cell surface protein [Ramlibacter sp.]
MGWLRKLRTDRNERVGPVAETMEPRLLYSADLAGALLLASTAQDAAEQRTLTHSGEYGPSNATARASATATQPAATEATVAETYAALPLTFEVNEGQAGSGVDFLAHGSGYGIALSGGNATLSLATAHGQQDVTLALLGAKQGVQGQGLGLLEGRSNYILGDDRSKWHTNIANYGSVVYRDVYDGIDVRYYGTQRQLEYDFI